MCIGCILGIAFADELSSINGTDFVQNSVSTNTYPSFGQLESLSPSDATGNVTVELMPENYNISKESNGFDLIYMNNFSALLSPGDPILPLKRYNILIPPDAQGSGIKLEIVSSEMQVLEGTFDIMPASPLMSWENNTSRTEWGVGKVIVNGKNTLVYENNADYPANCVSILPASQLRKWKFVPVEFMPFQYNPVTKKLTLFKYVKIRISYSQTLSTNAEMSALQADTVMDFQAPEIFANYLQMKGYYTGAETRVSWPGPTAVGYIIITSNAIKANSAKLNAFIAHKQSFGYNVLVITENDFGSLTGQFPNQKAEKIRQWLKNNYVSKGIKYVLLIGNPLPYGSTSGEGDIPMKMCWPNKINSQPADSTPNDCYYSDLTGNWDVDGDGYYGELDDDYGPVGGVDFSPEVIVGRIPVYNADYVSIDSILQKIIDYETQAARTWRKNTLFPMSYVDAYTDTAHLAERMKNDILISKGYSYWRMYHQGGGVCSSMDSVYPSEEELRAGTVVRDRWAGNDYGIMCWSGHGSPTVAQAGYSGCFDGWFFQSNDCSSLDNNHPSFTYHASCSNGYPEESNNIQYSLLKQGGISTVAATRQSWYAGIDYNYIAGTNSIFGIGYEYISRLTQDLPGGDALAQVKLNNPLPVGNGWLQNFYDFNLYGDPSVGLTTAPISSTWDSLGGYITSGPSIVVDNAGKIETWVRGGDNALWVNIDGTWRGKGGVLTSDPFAVKDYNGKIHILVRGSDYAVWDFIYDPVTSTGHWKGLGGYATSGPTGAMEPTYHNFLKVAARGADNALWQCDLNINTETINWYTNGGFLTSGPYVIFDPASRQHTLVRGGDNALWDCEGVLGADASYHWTWSGLGGVLSSGPTACIEPTYNDYVAVFVKGTDNALWMCDVYSATQPETGTWLGLGGFISSDPYAVADISANKIHVFVRGGDSALWENIFSTSPWNPTGYQWQGISGSILTYTPGAVIGSNTQAFAIGTDHALWRNTHATFSVASSGEDSSQKQEEPNQVNYPAGDLNSGGGKS